MVFIRRTHIVFILILMIPHISRSQTVNINIPVTLEMRNQSLLQAIDTLRKATGIFIAHTNSIEKITKKVSFTFTNTPFKYALDKVLEGTGYTYSQFHNQVILQPLPLPPVRFTISGFILESDSLIPVPYAAIFIQNVQIGAVADINGAFEIEIPESLLNDTVNVSSLGFETVIFPIKTIMNMRSVNIYLKKKVYVIDPVEIEPDKLRLIRLGNRKNHPAGSLYMDTHGQQVALYVNVENKRQGKIKRVWYYLSDEGNTEAPFRVRLYALDSLSGKPGRDLIPTILIAKPPSKAGWFSVDLRNFDLTITPPGFFVAMEGIFPNDYDFYINSEDFVDISTISSDSEIEDSPVVISYGQRLGYTKNKQEHISTWHYSLDHTWFQLTKQRFSIMVAADIILMEKIFKEK
jgi:hypothetical protein